MRIAVLTLYDIHLPLNLGQVGYSFFELGSCNSLWTKLPESEKAERVSVQDLSIGTWPLGVTQGSHMLPARGGDVPICCEPPKVRQQAGTLSPASCGSSLRK